MDIENICMVDSETRRVIGALCGDVTKVGHYIYSQNAFPVMWQYAIADGPVRVITLDHFDECLSWELDIPDELKRFHDRVDAGKAHYYAWNAAFDVSIWNGPFSDFPTVDHYMVRDAMAQAVASGLPGKLAAASKWLGVSEKLEQGSSLIGIFEPQNGGTPGSHPKEWTDYKTYGAQDIVAMRDILLYTRALSEGEWEEYAVTQIINDRGIAVDEPLCRAAAYMADISRSDTDKRIRALTDGTVTEVTKVADILKFAMRIATSYSELRDIFVKHVQVVNDDDTVTRPEKLSIERARIEQALAWLNTRGERDNGLEPDLQVLNEVLELRLYGGSNTPQKFSKILAVVHEGRLRGQYVFNGGAQTGRFSSRGVQIHNLVRDSLGDLEVAAIEFLTTMLEELENAEI